MEHDITSAVRPTCISARFALWVHNVKIHKNLILICVYNVYLYNRKQYHWSKILKTRNFLTALKCHKHTGLYLRGWQSSGGLWLFIVSFTLLGILWACPLWQAFCLLVSASLSWKVSWVRRRTTTCHSNRSLPRPGPSSGTWWWLAVKGDKFILA